MISLRKGLALAGIACAFAMTPAAQAQVDDRTAVSVMRECRKIADVSARVACYDNIPVDAAPVAAAPPAPAPAPSAQGFGADQLPREPRPRRAEPSAQELTARLARAQERQPGIWLLTLEDGAQWQFVDAMPASYNPPGKDSSVRIESAALGSYLMYYGGQRAVRIRRVR